MIGLPFVYTIVGLLLAGYALLGVRDRTNPKRAANGLFWGLLSLSFLGGDRLGDTGNGLLVLALVGAAAVGLGGGASSAPAPQRPTGEVEPRGDRLFLAALIVPAIALLGSLAFRTVPALIDTRQATLVALTFGVLVALAICMLWLRAPPIAPVEEGRRLMNAVSWAAMLPQMLSALGALFASAGVGDAVGRLIAPAVAHGSLPATVLAYGGGMALLTMAMGNAFAAFPVMAAAIGVPVLIQGHHGNAAAVASLGMLCGFCGTLLTPLAANYNLVPAALLDLPDRHGVIRAQTPTAFLMLTINLILLYWLAFPA